MRQTIVRRNVPPNAGRIEPVDARTACADDKPAIAVGAGGSDVRVEGDLNETSVGNSIEGGDRRILPGKGAKILFGLFIAQLFNPSVLQLPDRAVFSRHTQIKDAVKQLHRKFGGTQIKFSVAGGKKFSVSGAKPDCAGFILVGKTNFSARAAEVKILHHAVFEEAQSGVVRAHPKIRPAVFEQKNDAVARQSGRVVDVEGREGIAVEARETVERAEPEPAVARLDNGDDGVFRQPVRRVPDIHDEGRFRRRARFKKQRHRETDQEKWNSAFQSSRAGYAGPPVGKRFLKIHLRAVRDGLGWRCPMRTGTPFFG